jgi:hypothetical protein
MQLTKLFVLGLFGSAVSGLTIKRTPPTVESDIVKRTAATVASDIATVSSQLTTVDSAVNSFTGGLFQGLGLLIDFNTLKSDVTAATAEVTSTGALSSADSATIYSAVSALVTKIVTVLTDVEAKVCCHP